MKYNAKKTIALILSVVFVLMLFAGCGSSSNGGNESKPANRLEEIKQRGYITVTMEPYFAPNEFIDSSKTGDDQYVGSDIEFAKYIAEKLGVELQLVPLEFGAVLSSIVEGKYDLAISALGYTPERAESMELSKGYYFSDDDLGYGLVIREADKDVITSIEDLKDKVVMAQSGSLQESLLLQNVKEYGELKVLSSTPDCYMALSEGKSDCVCVAVAHVQLYMDANPDCGLYVMENVHFDTPEEFDGARVGAPKGETELIDFVNECIDELLASGQYAAWYDEYKEYAAKLGV
ncbi:MAG: transporter substrate-binding domain-containing protein [Oscillospiraceae bacterium]|nr:transporter substrate-binding domain-containing protein [Oscillospiraceae bacterium]MBR2805353.1 transporter substrate-binding domain-containing protein [Oscillospiraceae bacterium]